MMDIVSKPNDVQRAAYRAGAYTGESGWPPAVVSRRRRAMGVLPWRWAVPIIASVSTLLWIAIVLVMVWALADV